MEKEKLATLQMTCKEAIQKWAERTGMQASLHLIIVTAQLTVQLPDVRRSCNDTNSHTVTFDQLHHESPYSSLL